jgi:VanZ family protein
MEPRPSRFARYSLAVYGFLVVYASLYPFSGWRDQGLSPLEFLTAPLPRFITGFDLAANVVAYFPLGFLAVLAAAPRVRGAAAVACAVALTAVLSVVLEALQTYLPDRIPSNVDLATNVLGGFLGAAAGLATWRAMIARGGAHALRDGLFRPGAATDVGLVLVALWLFTQLNPETLLFGGGDLRGFFEAAEAELYAPETFVRIEAAVAGLNAAAVALLVAVLANPGRPVRLLAIAVIALAGLARAGAFGVLFAPGEALAWLTPGAGAGLVIGVAAAALLAGLPRRWAVAAAGLALMIATALVNLAPENPYLAHSLATWPQGHFLNFNGLTRLVSALWPFAALAYLLAGATRDRGANE